MASKNSRIAGDWQVGLAFDGQLLDLTPIFGSYQFSMEKDGNIIIQFENSSGTTSTLEGTWTFEDNKDTFQWEVEGDTLGFRYAKSENFDIIRLTNSEFWLLDKEFIELHLQ